VTFQEAALNVATCILSIHLCVRPSRVYDSLEIRNAVETSNL